MMMKKELELNKIFLDYEKSILNYKIKINNLEILKDKMQTDALNNEISNLKKQLEGYKSLLDYTKPNK